jgi:hypothetical protein
MSEIKHTPTPWKVVSDPHFDSGLVYTSIQPVTVDEVAMKPLAMMNGEFHICRMSHTAAEWRFNYHRANADFIVEAVNSHEGLTAERDRLREAFDRRGEIIIDMSEAAIRLRKALKDVEWWAQQKCPCHEETPNPCPLCGASVENLEACKAVESVFPRELLKQVRAALSPVEESKP